MSSSAPLMQPQGTGEPDNACETRRVSIVEPSRAQIATAPAETPSKSTSHATRHRIVHQTSLLGSSHVAPPAAYQGTVSVPHSGASSVLESDLAPQLEELRRSHAVLHRQVVTLKEDLQSTMRTQSEAQRSAALYSSTFDFRVLRRGMQFARMAAVRALHTGSSESVRVRRGCSRAHSFKQTVLRSQSTDFTLHEFHLLASACDRNSELRCKIIPSSYYAAFPNVRGILRMAIVFDSYYDICEALGIDVVDREEGLYREKKTSARVLRAIQVLGVSCIRPRMQADETDEMDRDETNEDDEGKYHDRALIVGAGIPSSSCPFRIPILFQESTKWSEDSWEEGLVYRAEPSSFFSTSVPSSHTTLRFAEDAESPRTSALNKTPCANSFSLVWERRSEGCSPGELEPQLVPGTLRSFFPAVVLRTHILVSTAQQVFNNPLQGSTDTYLCQVIVSPPVLSTSVN